MVMYIIVTYDVQEKKCCKMMKILRKYLYHTQNSVFEGELTPRQEKKLREQIRNITDEKDKVVFYYTFNNKQMKKEYVRGEKIITNIIY